eukprot:68623_1
MAKYDIKDINYDIFNQWKQERYRARLDYWEQHHNVTLRNDTNTRQVYVNTPQHIWKQKFKNFKTISPLTSKFHSVKQSMKDIVSNLPDIFVKTIKAKLQNVVQPKISKIVQSNDM